MDFMAICFNIICLHMVMNIIEVLLVLIIFFPTKWFAWKITEVWGLPQWLDYQPYSCKKCLTFWLLTALFLSCGLLCHLWITMAVGGLITALDTIAVIVDQRKKTVSAYDNDIKSYFDDLGIEYNEIKID